MMRRNAARPARQRRMQAAWAMASAATSVAHPFAFGMRWSTTLATIAAARTTNQSFVDFLRGTGRILADDEGRGEGTRRPRPGRGTEGGEPRRDEPRPNRLQSAAR